MSTGSAPSSAASPAAARRSSTRRSRASGSPTPTPRVSSTTVATSRTSTTHAPSTTATSAASGSRARLVMRASHVEYHAPARFDDLLECFARVSRIGRTSVTYDFLALRLPDDTLMVTATQAIVLVDRATRRPAAIPESVREPIRAFEGNDLVEQSSDRAQRVHRREARGAEGRVELCDGADRGRREHAAREHLGGTTTCQPRLDASAAATSPPSSTPATPPASEEERDSTRNCRPTWRRVAPSAGDRSRSAARGRRSPSRSRCRRRRRAAPPAPRPRKSDVKVLFAAARASIASEGARRQPRRGAPGSRCARARRARLRRPPGRCGRTARRRHPRRRGSGLQPRSRRGGAVERGDEPTGSRRPTTVKRSPPTTTWTRRRPGDPEPAGGRRSDHGGSGPTRRRGRRRRQAPRRPSPGATDRRRASRSPWSPRAGSCPSGRRPRRRIPLRSPSRPALIRATIGTAVSGSVSPRRRRSTVPVRR